MIALPLPISYVSSSSDYPSSSSSSFFLLLFLLLLFLFLFPLPLSYYHYDSSNSDASSAFFCAASCSKRSCRAKSSRGVLGWAGSLLFIALAGEDRRGTQTTRDRYQAY